jgi:hypothetical protein
MGVEEIERRAKASDIGQVEVQESLLVLAQHGLLRTTDTSAGIATVHVSIAAFELYAEHSISDYGAKKRAIASAILNDDLTVNGEIAQQLHPSVPTSVRHFPL